MRRKNLSNVWSVTLNSKSNVTWIDIFEQSMQKKRSSQICQSLGKKSHKKDKERHGSTSERKLTSSSSSSGDHKDHKHHKSSEKSEKRAKHRHQLWCGRGRRWWSFGALGCGFLSLLLLLTIAAAAQASSKLPVSRAGLPTRQPGMDQQWGRAKRTILANWR